MRPAAWVLLILLAAGCGGPKPPVSRTWTAMGTFASVSVPHAERNRLAPCAEVTRGRMEALESGLSTYRDDSEISRLNAAGGAVVPVAPTTRELLELSRRFSAQTGGRFDATVAPLVTLWGFHRRRDPPVLPDPQAVQEALALVGYRQIALTDAGAALGRAGVRVDLGGIAKGYAVDACFEPLVAGGARNLMVNLGGNLRCAGQARPGAPWVIGVRNPFDRAALLGTLELTGGRAVATSGNYERFVEIDGRRYAHIIDPRTGRPVQGMAGLTVVATTAVAADALSTALFVAGPPDAPAVLARFPAVDALLVPDEQPLRILVTPGFAERFRPVAEHRAAVQPLPLLTASAPGETLAP